MCTVVSVSRDQQTNISTLEHMTTTTKTNKNRSNTQANALVRRRRWRFTFVVSGRSGGPVFVFGFRFFGGFEWFSFDNVSAVVLVVSDRFCGCTKPQRLHSLGIQCRVFLVSTQSRAVFLVHSRFKIRFAF